MLKFWFQICCLILQRIAQALHFCSQGPKISAIIPSSYDTSSHLSWTTSFVTYRNREFQISIYLSSHLHFHSWYQLHWLLYPVPPYAIFIMSHTAPLEFGNASSLLSCKNVMQWNGDISKVNTTCTIQIDTQRKTIVFTETSFPHFYAFTHFIRVFYLLMRYIKSHQNN